MLISATSALVLNWAHHSLWESEAASRYMSGLDLSEGDQLLKLFREDNQELHVHIVSDRKFFMKKHADALLSAHPDGQVIILAAGLAPLSIEIASRHPGSLVFDVDKYLMQEKWELAGETQNNIRFISCDITNTGALHDNLNTNGFDPEKPTLIVLEGIIYYLDKDELQSVLASFKGNNLRIAGDFCLLPTNVDERAQEIIEELWANIMGLVGLKSVQCYSEEMLSELLIASGLSHVSFTNMREVQKQRTGDHSPFESPQRAWLRAVSAQR